MTRYDILPPAQALVLHDLAPTARLGHVLYGGTAIALQLGHRQSIDFDFFSSLPLDVDALIASMPFLAQGVSLMRQPESWTLQVEPIAGDRPVKLSFFGGLRFGRVGNPVPSERGELLMASLDDLFGHKVKVVLQRIEAKDYEDIAALLRAGHRLENGLGAASALFPATFPPADAVRTLTWFEGGDLDRLSREDRATLAEAAARVGEIVPASIIAVDLTIDAA